MDFFASLYTHDIKISGKNIVQKSVIHVYINELITSNGSPQLRIRGIERPNTELENVVHQLLMI